MNGSWSDAQTEPTWTEKVLLINEAFAERKLPFAFGGAIAMNYHREPRSTLDIDINIFLSAHSQDVVVEALQRLYGLPDEERVRRELTATAQTRSAWGNTYVDLFFNNIDFHESMASRVVREPFAGTEIPVLSIEDLIISKTVFSRPKDWVDIAAVGEARRGQLDLPYIEHWLGEFFDSDDERFTKLRAALSAAAGES
jgi:hypothetical protein